ncbi:MAG: hypothetical protein KF814_11070 [Nitrospiraceae bacterium]|nr:hypothetical protein [Nitrospiraceae bacterium]
MTPLLRIGVLGLALTLVTGCSGAKVTSKAAPQLPQYRVHKVVLIPFDTLSTPQVLDLNGPAFPVPSGARRSEMSVGVPATTDRFDRPTHLVPPDAGEKITDLMWAKLKSKPGLEILSPSEASRAARDLAINETGRVAAAHKIAQRLSADGALVGKVLVFQERVGSRLGANPPAAVGFEVRLVASDGAVLWEGNYYEKQRPMTEDFVGFIQRHGVFVTADELAAYGAAELAEEFPYGTAQ